MVLGTTRREATTAERALLRGALISSFGTGIYVTIAPLYFVYVIELGAGPVGLALTVAALLGLACAIPIGRVADRFDPRLGFASANVACALTMAPLAAVGEIVGFVTVACLGSLTMTWNQAVRASLVRAVAQDGGLPWFRNRMRVAFNLGFGLGAALASVALTAESMWGYRAVILINALTFAGAALLAYRIPSSRVHAPRRTSTEEGPARRAGAIRDRRFVALTATNGVLSLQFPVLTFLLPLWIAGHTDLPTAFISVCLVLNAVLVVEVQRRLGHLVDSPATAARAATAAGALFAVSVVSYSLLPQMTWAVAITVVVVATVVHSVAEVIHTSASMEVMYGLAASEAQAEYASLYLTGQGLATNCGPAVLAFLCLESGSGGAGWWLLAGLMAAAGCATRVMLRGRTFDAHLAGAR